MNGLNGAMLRVPLTLACAMLCGAASAFMGARALAMVGGAQPAGDIAGAVVLIVGSRGTSCTGATLARDLVLTAAHCVLAGADYKLVDFEDPRAPTLQDTTMVARHPGFDVAAVLRHRVTADVALVKLAGPRNAPATRLAPAGVTAAAGDRFVVAGFGLATRGDGKSGGIVRAATLVATGQPGSLQIRLVDPATKGERPGLGACTGDSGAPVFRDSGGSLSVIGVVSWSTGPKLTDGCGGLTGVTPIARYRAWIIETAAKFGSPLAP